MAGAESAGSVLLTGASGFLGKVVLGRLLTRPAEVDSVLLLLRAKDEEGALRRVREEILGTGALGADGDAILREWLESGRARALPVDLSRDGVEGGGWGKVDTVIHCAATVSFEEPLDDALRTNALGPLRLFDAARGTGADPRFVHVSTAYAAECRTDVVTEADYAHPGVGALDPDAMMATARSWRGAGKEGPELSELSRRWAVEAGWPDTYALSKALGERLIAEHCSRLTILRPSIIESSLRHPRPGWLEGIKVADPLILAYGGRGLTHIAGRRENRIDIVPVDCVADACVAAALYPTDEPLRVFAVASGARNPLPIGDLAKYVQSYFSRLPLAGDTPKPVRDLNFVDRRSAVRAAQRRQRLAAATARAARAPLVPAGTRRRLRRLARLSAQITRMVKIYAPYTELDVVFDDSNLQALAAQMSPEDRAAFPFDTAGYEWSEYLDDIHLPEVRRMARSPGRKP
jgi:alcohol-forming fatty acyl-CoA reductase